MNEKEIRRLALLLPTPNYVGGPEPKTFAGMNARKHSDAEKLAYSLDEPAFGWLAMVSFAGQGLPLPIEAVPQSLRKAYIHVTGQRRDAAIAEAIAVTYPGQAHRRGVLQALLIAPQGSFEEIAKCIGMSGASVVAFHDLFWAVRDRADDPAFVAGLVYPHGRIGKAERAKLPFAARLRVVAYEEGAAAVLDVAGLVPARNRKKEGNVPKLLRETILEDGLADALDGNVSSETVKLAVKLLTAQQADPATNGTIDDAKMGLTYLAFHKPVLDTIKRMQQSDIEERLAAQQERFNNMKTASTEPKD